MPKDSKWVLHLGKGKHGMIFSFFLTWIFGGRRSGVLVPVVLLEAGEVVAAKDSWKAEEEYTLSRVLKKLIFTLVWLAKLVLKKLITNN